MTVNRRVVALHVKPISKKCQVLVQSIGAVAMVGSYSMPTEEMWVCSSFKDKANHCNG